MIAVNKKIITRKINCCLEEVFDFNDTLAPTQIICLYSHLAR